MRIKILKEFARNPQVDWITILFLTVVIMVGLALNAFSLYNAVVNGRITGTMSPDPSFNKVNEKIISTVIDKFAGREEVSEKALKGYTGAPDPSL